MVKSAFAKSLPSRRRKERDTRSSRHHGGGDSEGGGSVGRTLSGEEAHRRLESPSLSPPRPPRVSLENNQDDNGGERKRRWGASPSSFDDDIHDNDDDGNAAEEEHSPAVSSMSEGSIVEGTQLNDNIEMPTSRLERGQKSDDDDGSEASRRRLRCHQEDEENRLEEERLRALELDVVLKQAESVKAEREKERLEHRRLEDETTRKRTESENYERERVLPKQSDGEVKAQKLVNEGVGNEGGGNDAYRATRKTLIATQRADGDSQPLLDEYLSPEIELSGNVETREDENCPVIGNHSIEITESAEIIALQGDTLTSFNAMKSVKSYPSCPNQDNILPSSGSDFTLTTSDIKSCIASIKVANDILQADPSRDPFDGIDIERWKSDLMKFGRYIVTLGDPKTTEAVEIEKFNDREKALAMFCRGMKVNHCNAVFVHHMLFTISHGIKNSREGSAHHHKIDHLAECMDRIFGVTNEDSVSTYSVSITTGGTEGTSLKFSLSTEATIDGHKDSTSMTSLPPHLVAMSQIFETYALEEMRPFRLQMDSTHETLIATREGAMGLQRRALELQDELHRTRNDAATEFKKQKYNLLKSFSRKKEQYQAEMMRQKEEYERELRALKVELAKAKHVHTEQLATEQRQRIKSNERREDKLVSGRSKRTKRNVRQEEITKTDDGSEFLIRRPTLNASFSEKQLNASYCVETNEAGAEQFSPSIPKHIMFGANTHESDLEESTGKYCRSRHMLDTKTPRNSRSATYEMRSHRQSIGSTVRGIDSTTRRDQGGGDERNGDSSRRFRENPLKPDIRDNNDDDVRFSETRQNQPFDKNGRTSNPVSTSKRYKVSDNVSLKPATNAAAEPTFAYQEVVRGRANRQALPGHECEECRKWFDAVGNGYDRADMVKECSRHRALHAPPSTPEDYWRLTFVDER